MGKRRLNHTPLCPDGTCRSCTLRRRHIRLLRPRDYPTRKTVYRHWTTQEERILAQGGGVKSAEEIQSAILLETGGERSLNAIRIRMSQLGLPLTLPGLTISEVAHAMGTGFHRVHRWVKRGLLGPPNGLHCMGRIREDDLERFLREHMDVYDRLQIRSPYLRSIADAAWNRDPLLPIGAVCLLTGMSEKMVVTRFRKGVIPAIKAVKPGGGPCK